MYSSEKSEINENSFKNYFPFYNTFNLDSFDGIYVFIDSVLNFIYGSKTSGTDGRQLNEQTFVMVFMRIMSQFCYNYFVIKYINYNKYNNNIIYLK